jgi:excinuclease ABC subunit A
MVKEAAHLVQSDAIRIRGARQHNLAGVDLDIPRNRLVVFTGVSGSGKSSLAFDTLFAEGQRRYVESLSAYARQFLGQMDKPRYDAISGLTPTIAVSQKAFGRNPRSTVGTMTEVHDHLRVLFARVGVQHCPRCGRPVRRRSAGEIAAELANLPETTQLLILAPFQRSKTSNQATPIAGTLREIQKAGFVRVRTGGDVRRIDELLETPTEMLPSGPMHIAVDRIVWRAGQEDRLTDSIETALRAGQGVMICEVGGEGDRVYSEHNRCFDCELAFPDLEPSSFSFNNPAGACPECSGLGTCNTIDPKLVVPDETLTLHQGAIRPWEAIFSRREGWSYTTMARLGEVLGFDLDTPWGELPERARQAVLFGLGDERFEVDWKGSRSRKGRFEIEWEGCIPSMERRMRETKSDQMRELYLGYLSNSLCTACRGARLRPESAAVRLGAVSIVDLSRQTVAAARNAIHDLGLEGTDALIAEDLVREVDRRLRFLEEVGLGYLTLDRSGDTLSGGEGQRIRLASQLGGELTGVTYVLDEPSIGLHPRDTRRLVSTLERLRDLGNTVVVVEHDRDTILAADRVVDFGPGAGRLGGQVVFEGPPSELLENEASLTGRYLSGRIFIEVPRTRRESGSRSLRVVGARLNNLQSVTVKIPLGLMVAVTGVSGAGKSSLVKGILAPYLHNVLGGGRQTVGACDRLEGVENLDKIVDIDQSPIGRTPRSNPATYTKLFEAVRDLFAETKEARARGFGPARFSFNQKGGRCEACGGDGWRRIEMHFLADVLVPCELCKGTRFNEATLSVRYKGKNIADVLSMTVDEALSFFAAHPTMSRILATLAEVGLGYIELGQPSDTLSGGEAQRVKLARELSRVSTGETLYVLDEPTTGLHFDDTRKLLAVLRRLVTAGNTVLVVEHNPDVVKCCDWVIDLGPEGGAEGGRVVAEGTPEAVARVVGSHTGRVLSEVLQHARR